MRRPSKFRKAPPASVGWSMIEHMADVNFNTPRSPTRTKAAARTTTTSPITSPPSPRISLSKRDTGFPEGFCGNRNTTLPHPSANLSPDACITEDDIAITRALARHRMSFIAQKDKQHRMSRGVSLNAIEETEHQQHQQHYSSPSRGGGGFLAGGRDPSFSTVGRLALSSLHGAEFRRHLRRPGSNGTNASDDSGVTNNTAATATSTITNSAGRVSSVFSEEEEREASCSVASSPPSSPSPSPYQDGHGNDGALAKRLLDKDKHEEAAVEAPKGKGPRDEKRDPRDGRVGLATNTDGRSDADVERKAKRRSSFTWFRRLVHP